MNLPAEMCLMSALSSLLRARVSDRASLVTSRENELTQRGETNDMRGRKEGMDGEKKQQSRRKGTLQSGISENWMCIKREQSWASEQQ